MEYSNQRIRDNNTLQQTEIKVLNNYWSIGIDAKIALKFHESRNANPTYFANQNVNKMWYGNFGAREMIDGCPKLHRYVELHIDGVQIDLKKHKLEGFIVLNLPSCYGGACLWGASPKGFEPMRINDGLLEIVGLKSSLHLGQCQTGVASPAILGQGKEVRIVLNDEAKKRKERETS